jgi:hypothetical protein
LDDYLQAAVATHGIVPMKVLALDTESKTVDGNPPGPRSEALFGGLLLLPARLGLIPASARGGGS